MSEAAASTSKKTRQGVVTSSKMDKTIVVEVTRRYRHRKYGKFIKRRLTYKAHDEKNECGEGDLVLIEECRPLSKQKRWRVKDIVQKATIV